MLMHVRREFLPAYRHLHELGVRKEKRKKFDTIEWGDLTRMVVDAIIREREVCPLLKLFSRIFLETHNGSTDGCSQTINY